MGYPICSLIPFWISDLGSASRAWWGSQWGAVETGEVLGVRAREGALVGRLQPPLSAARGGSGEEKAQF